MPTFNLVDEPWIRCIPESGGAPLALSLRDTLGQAHTLRELADDSPLVAVALHRLLLAILHRAYQGPGTVAEWRAIRSAGQFDISRVNAYLAAWRHRFDLFDPQRPFYQTPELLGVKPVSVAKLAHEKASGNNITLFDHTTPETAAMSPAQAARYLIAFQAYAAAGGNSQPFYFSDAPLTRNYTVLVRGVSLFETLLFNLVRYNQDRPIGWLKADDAPQWEQTDQRTPVQSGTPPTGYLDYLTWQSRRIYLVCDPSTGRVRDCQLLQYLVVDKETRDPFQAYFVSAKQGVHARQLSEQRAAWRDSHALLEAAQEANLRPAVFDWLAEAMETGLGRSRRQARQVEFDILGILNEPGQDKPILWRHDHLPLPLTYLTALELRNRLRDGLQHAEDVAGLFKPIKVKSQMRGKDDIPRPLYRLAQEILRGGGLQGVLNEREVDDKVIKKFAKRFDTERVYWAALEPHFRRFMTRLAERMESGGQEAADQTLLEWSRDVESCAHAAFHLTLSGFNLSARTARARALAERDFKRQLGGLLRRERQAWIGSQASALDSTDSPDPTDFVDLVYEPAQEAEL